MDVTNLLTEFLKFAKDNYGQSLYDHEAFYCTSDEGIIKEFCKMQTIHILSSEELAELQELVDELRKDYRITYLEVATQIEKTVDVCPDEIKRIAEILGLEVDEGE